MRFASVILLTALLTAGIVNAQKTDYVFLSPQSEDPTQPYTDDMIGGQFSGPLSVTGPFDLDGDGKVEVLLTDYSGGQRVHVFEVQGPDTWEMVYSTPYHEVTSVGTRGARYATAGDLDGDGFQEIIFVSGQNWVETEDHPIADRGTGIFVYEHTGEDDDYGSTWAAAFGTESFGTPEPIYVKADNFSVVDVDDDGIQELLWPNDDTEDEWFIFSVNGDIGSGFETLVQELRLSTRASDSDPVNRGGGSPYAVNAADLDGDGAYEISLHAWNNFNFTNAVVTGPDAYEFPDQGDPNLNLQATGNDDLSWFNGVVVDINGDGDDEIFYPREYGYEDAAGGNVYEYVSVLNYEPDEDVLQVTPDQLIVDLVGPLTAYGIDVGDLDGDGTPELIGAGRGFAGADLTAGQNPSYLRIAQWMGGIGGDPEDASNYSIAEIEFEVSEHDSLFNVIHRDSLGVTTTYYESAGNSGAYPTGQSEELTPNRIAYLGDADEDGEIEIAASFYGINDTLDVIDETWNPDEMSYDRTVRERNAVEERPMMRIFEVSEDLIVSVDEPDRSVPNQFVLEQNYPNPFNPSTRIAFEVPDQSEIRISVFDVTGRQVATLVDGPVAAGRHVVLFDGASLSSGTYLIRMDTPQGRLTRKAVLVK